jgi:hypothetical protein
MPLYHPASLNELSTCSPDLQSLATAALEKEYKQRASDILSVLSVPQTLKSEVALNKVTKS